MRNIKRMHIFLRDYKKETGVNLTGGKDLSRDELELTSHEIKIITDELSKQVAKDKEFNYYNKIKNEIDYWGNEIDWDKFIDKILDFGGYDYIVELLKICRYHFEYLRYESEYYSKNKEILPYILISYNLLEDGFWHLRLQYKSDYKHFRIKIDMKDIIMAVIMQDHNDLLFNLIRREMMVSEIYK